MRKNIFIIGDVVIDHTVFVSTPTGPFPENIYRVTRRQDTAGGAANVARILGVLNEGRTYLWGVIGSSRWGSFRRILEHSHLLDGARSNVEFRGAQDETDAQMNTITRLVLVKEDGRMERKIRFDDLDHVHVPDTKREYILYHLEHVHDERDPLDAIIIDDLDKKCLTKELVKAISEFAERNHIPLFVDPKRDRSKYTDIKGTAILPNLMEWCYLVNDSQRYDFWRDNLDSPEVLKDMALRSFRYLGNFKYHIITCDILGAVIIAPHPERKHLYAVYRAQAEQAENQLIDGPLGCGDLITGVFAAEYDRSKEDKADSTEQALNAFHRANVAVGCYCEMPWHRMPNLELVRERQAKSLAWTPAPLAEPSKGMLYLPQTQQLVLSECETVLPRIYSANVAVRDKLIALLEEISNQTQQVTPKSIFFGAPSGSGKSKMIEGLLRVAPQFGIHAVECSKSRLIEMTQRIPASLQEFLVQQTTNSPQPPGPMRYFLIVDEAAGDYLGDKSMLDLLQWAHVEGIRFMFVDSLFCTPKRQQLKIMPDIISRCSTYELPGIPERPGDIPYLIANKLLELAEADGIRTIKVEGRLLLSVTDQILEDGNPREQLNNLVVLHNKAKSLHQSGQTLLIRLDDKVDKVGLHTKSSMSGLSDDFTVSR